MEPLSNDQARLTDHISAGTFGGFQKPVRQVEAEEVKRDTISARLGSNGQYRTLFGFNYNGEKNFGEIGPLKDYRPDYPFLRARSWQLYLESDMFQTILGRYATWVIGKGLKIQAEPEKLVLEMEGVTLDTKKFSKQVEARFKLFAKSKRSDSTKVHSLNWLEKEAFKNAKIAGDVLVILYYDDVDGLNVQLIDGADVISPMYGSDWFPRALANGNRIEHGIELNDSNEHIAYYVREVDNSNLYTFKTRRVPAVGKTGMTRAYMYYGNKYRIGSQRGMPLLAVIFETMKKMDRYKEAVVGGAEERAKVALTIEHELGGSGKNPMLAQTALARDLVSGSGDIPITNEGDVLAKNVTATQGKTAYNLPPGAKMTALEGTPENNFASFFEKNWDISCAAAQIPPEVAASKYGSNFSASRAALKDWENQLNVERADAGAQFLQPIFDFYLHILVIKNKVNAPGYLEAFNNDNHDVLDAYRNVRWVGAAVPHIDPLKEVEAERAKMGVAGAAVPLTTAEQATENLNGGDYDTNLEQFAEELKESISKGVKIPEPPAPGGAPVPGKKPKKKKR